MGCALLSIASGIGIDPTLPRDGTDFMTLRVVMRIRVWLRLCCAAESVDDSLPRSGIASTGRQHSCGFRWHLNRNENSCGIEVFFSRFIDHPNVFALGCPLIR